MTDDEINRVEDIVNKHISMNLSVNTKLMSIDDAKKKVQWHFSVKNIQKKYVLYPWEISARSCAEVRMYPIQELLRYSKFFQRPIVAGVRRIEALTGHNVLAYYKELENKLYEAARAAKAELSQLTDRIEGLHEEIKALKSENEKLKSKLASESLGDVMNQVRRGIGSKALALMYPIWI